MELTFVGLVPAVQHLPRTAVRICYSYLVDQSVLPDLRRRRCMNKYCRDVRCHRRSHCEIEPDLHENCFGGAISAEDACVPPVV